MKILIVGGTGFLGGAVTQAALDAGHDVTILSRGVKPNVAGARCLTADRNVHLPDLPPNAFDAVVDTCAYTPEMVTTLLAAVGPVHYVLVSSASVYADLTQPQVTEDEATPTATSEHLRHAADIPLDRRADANAYGAAYGPLKRACELVAGDATIIRLGLIVGADDYTDRFTWWVRRMDQGGIVPVPAPRNRNMQLIDVRDAANFILRLAKRQQSGTFNVTGPVQHWDHVLNSIARISGTESTLRWLPLARFTRAGLEPWTDLPLILPDGSTVAQLLNISTAKADRAGLNCRPLDQTIRDILAWDRGQREMPLHVGMSRDQETAVLG